MATGNIEQSAEEQRNEDSDDAQDRKIGKVDQHDAMIASPVSLLKPQGHGITSDIQPALINPFRKVSAIWAGP